MKTESFPVRHEVQVAASPIDTFRAFTERVGDWWPLATHSLSLRACGEAATSCAFEGGVGGRLFETMADGRRADWGDVLEWVPGERLRFTWYVAVEREQTTEVDVRFEPSAGGTRVVLEHRGWEAFGDRAAEQRGDYERGWAAILSDSFARHVTRAA